MAYKDKEEEKRKKKEWHINNPDRVKAMRERYNEKRRQMRLSDPEYLKRERIQKRMARLKMTEEELAAYDAKKREEERKYKREWARNHSTGRHQKLKSRMEKDSEFAAKIREQWKNSNAKRRAKGIIETTEQRECRLQRLREFKAKQVREKRLLEAMSGEIKMVVKTEKPKERKPKYNPKTNSNFKKPGRILAQFKWNGY